MTDELAPAKLAFTFITFLIVVVITVNCKPEIYSLIASMGVLTMFFIRIINTNLNL